VRVRDLVRAEYKLVYAEMIRRKSELVLLILYPYVFTGFILLVGSGVGSPRVFEERVGVNPALFLITAGFAVMALMICIDDILWRPIWETWIGTLPYVFASPVNKLLLFSVMPLPRASLVVLIGSTSLVPLYAYQYGLAGIPLALLVVLLVVVGVFTMIPLSILTSGLLHAFGESWRAVNIVRPLVIVLLGVYYPRFYMPLVARLLSYALPSSHVVESIQRILLGLVDELTVLLLAAGVLLALLYTPASRKSLVLWEKRKVREGVKTS
jgi:ABC-2 type transport system permease protein